MNAPAPLDALSPSVETLRHCDTPASSSNPELLDSWGYPTPGQSQTPQLLGQWDPTAMPRARKLVQRTKEEEDLHWVQGSPSSPGAPAAPRALPPGTALEDRLLLGLPSGEVQSGPPTLSKESWVAGMPSPLMPSVSDSFKQLPTPNSFRKASRMEQVSWSRNAVPTLCTALFSCQPSCTSLEYSVSPHTGLHAAAAATYGLIQLCGGLRV